MEQFIKVSTGNGSNEQVLRLVITKNEKGEEQRTWIPVDEEEVLFTNRVKKDMPEHEITLTAPDCEHYDNV